ncbi:MAG: Ig-like domain-containing protein [Lachnospiraceae bacterium]|nr:Ig-like domain-containing protein [Lachnospiraceae bacterium]
MKKRIHFVKRILTGILTAAMILSEPLSAFADETEPVIIVVTEDPSPVIVEEPEGVSAEEPVREAEENISEEEWNHPEEQQPQEEYQPEESPEIREEPEEVTKRIISGFSALDEADRSILVNKKAKLSLAELLAKMPSQIRVTFTDGSSEQIPTSWFAVGADYEKTDGYYYQFSPDFDTNRYALSEGMDIVRDAPYIEVFVVEQDGEEQPVQEKETLPAIDPAPLSGSQSQNRTQIFNYLTGNLGLTTAAACGVLANIYCESGFNPQALGDNGTSYGLCQWHNGRFTNLRNYCLKNGYDYRTVSGQLSYLGYELTYSYSSTLKLLKSLFNDSEAAYYAGYSWCYNFERPKNTGAVSIVRGNLARDKYWVSYGGSTNSAPIELLKAESGVLKTLEEEEANRKNGDTAETPLEEEEEKLLTLSQPVMVLLAGGDSAKLYADMAVLQDQEEQTDSLEISWSTGDEKVARVSRAGNVTPVAAGKTLITATLSRKPAQEEEKKDKKETDSETAEAEPEILAEAVCEVTVLENEPERMEEPEQREFKTAESGPVRFGWNERYADVTVSYMSAMAYTGKEAEPERDLQAVTDYSALTALIDEFSMIRKEGFASQDMISVSYVVSKETEAGEEVRFYPVLTLEANRAKEAGFKRRELEELETLILELNGKLSAEPCTAVINPFDLSDAGNTIRVILKNREPKLTENEISNIKSIKVIDESRRIYRPVRGQVELELMDIRKGLLVLSAAEEGNYTGRVTVSIRSER